MKSIALLLCLLCVFGTGHALVIINAQVNFGAKKYGCERGAGICLIKIDSKNQTQENFVQISLSPDKMNIQIDFPEELMMRYPQQFRERTFIQEDEFEIPDEVARALGLSGSVMIPVGKYSLQDLGDRMRLTLPVGR
jgi:hypothetical protein